MHVKDHWQLAADPAEIETLRSILAGCGPGDFAPPAPDAPAAVPAAGPAPDGPPAGDAPPNPGDTKNCGDFGTQAEAQAWHDTYSAHYGDVARLYADGDGTACASLP